jgi:GldM C-terminal domain.
MALEFPEYKVVYRGYNNLLEVSTRTKLNPKFIELKCDGAKLERKENNLWNLNPFTTDDSLELTLLNSKTREVIDRFVYVVKKLPDPQLYVGASDSGQLISRLETRLFARYSDSPLRAEFTVKEAVVAVEGYNNTIRVKGNSLGNDYLEFVKNIPHGTTVRIKAFALGPDGLEHVIYGEYFY